MLSPDFRVLLLVWACCIEVCAEPLTLSANGDIPSGTWSTTLSNNRLSDTSYPIHVTTQACTFKAVCGMVSIYPNVWTPPILKVISPLLFLGSQVRSGGKNTLAFLALPANEEGVGSYGGTSTNYLWTDGLLILLQDRKETGGRCGYPLLWTVQAQQWLGDPTSSFSSGFVLGSGKATFVPSAVTLKSCPPSAELKPLPVVHGISPSVVPLTVLSQDKPVLTKFHLFGRGLQDVQHVIVLNTNTAVPTEKGLNFDSGGTVLAFALDVSVVGDIVIQVPGTELRSAHCMCTVSVVQPSAAVTLTLPSSMNLWRLGDELVTADTQFRLAALLGLRSRHQVLVDSDLHASPRKFTFRLLPWGSQRVDDSLTALRLASRTGDLFHAFGESSITLGSELLPAQALRQCSGATGLGSHLRLHWVMSAVLVAVLVPRHGILPVTVLGTLLALLLLPPSLTASASSLSCRAGEYLHSHRGICVQCPSNSSSPPNSTSYDDCSCSAGFWQVETPTRYCAPCAAGTFKSVAGAAKCVNCAAGTVSLSGSTGCVCPEGFGLPGTGRLCSQCSPGWYGPEGGPCVECAAGTFSHSGQSSCRDCPSNQYATTARAAMGCAQCPGWSTSPPRSTYCTCNPGTVGPATTGLCTPCAAGTFKNATQAEQAPCATCPTGRTSGSGATGCYCVPGWVSDITVSGSSPCTPCDAGTYRYGQSECRDCPSNEYSTTAATGCARCPALSTGPPRGTSVANCTCRSGTVGSAATGRCTPCVAGTYKNTTQAEQAPCATCPNGRTSESGASQCLYCAPGWADLPVPGRVPEPCAPCTPGRYNAPVPGVFSSGCKDCNPNSFSRPAASKCDLCPVDSARDIQDGSVCVCVPGSSGPAFGPCVRCARGMYKEASGSSPCSSCPTNSTTRPGTLAASLDDCECLTGHVYSRTSMLDSFACTPCESGRYKAAYGGTKPCDPCPVGKYAPQQGQNQCQSCPLHSTNQQGSSSLGSCRCDVGWSGQDGDSCAACGVGKYKDALGSATCATCPDMMTTQKSAAASSTACVCVEGWYHDTNISCALCPAGTASFSLGAPSCVDCPQRSYSTSGSTNCILCPPTLWSPTRSPSVSSCTCAAGYTGDAVRQQWSPCPYSTYKPEPGFHPCTPCPAGTSTVEPAATTASKCITLRSGIEFCASMRDSGRRCVPGLDILGRTLDITALESPNDISKLLSPALGFTATSEFSDPSVAGFLPSDSHLKLAKDNIAVAEAHEASFSSASSVRDTVAAQLGVSISNTPLSLSLGSGVSHWTTFSSSQQLISWQYKRKLWHLSVSPPRLEMAVLPDLRRELSALPTAYDFLAYSDFIRNHGTHVITQVQLGGSLQFFSSEYQCRYASFKTKHMTLGATAAKTLGVSLEVGVEVEVSRTLNDEEKAMSKHWRLIKLGGNDRVTGLPECKGTCPLSEWWQSLPQQPAVISYRLAEISELAPSLDVKANLQRVISGHVARKDGGDTLDDDLINAYSKFKPSAKRLSVFASQAFPADSECASAVSC